MDQTGDHPLRRRGPGGFSNENASRITILQLNKRTIEKMHHLPLAGRTKSPNPLFQRGKCVLTHIFATTRGNDEGLLNIHRLWDENHSWHEPFISNPQTLIQEQEPKPERRAERDGSERDHGYVCAKMQGTAAVSCEPICSINETENQPERED